MPTSIQYVALLVDTRGFPDRLLHTQGEQIADIQARVRILARLIVQAFESGFVHLMDPNVIVVIAAPEFFFRGGSSGYYKVPETADVRGRTARFQFMRRVQQEIVTQLPIREYQAQIVLFPGTIPLMSDLRFERPLFSADTKKIENIAPIIYFDRRSRSWQPCGYIAKQLTSLNDHPYSYEGYKKLSVVFALKHPSASAQESGLLHGRASLTGESEPGHILSQTTHTREAPVSAAGTDEPAAFHSTISPHERHEERMRMVIGEEQERLREKTASKYGLLSPHGGMFQIPISGGGEPTHLLWWNLQVCLDYRKSRNRIQWEELAAAAQAAAGHMPVPDISVLISNGMNVITGSGTDARQNLVRNHGYLLHCDSNSANIFRNTGTFENPNMKPVRNALNKTISRRDDADSPYFNNINMEILIFKPLVLEGIQMNRVLRFFGF